MEYHYLKVKKSRDPRREKKLKEFAAKTQYMKCQKSNKEV